MPVVDVVGQCHHGRLRRLVNNQYGHIAYAFELLEMCDPLHQTLGTIARCQTNGDHDDTAR
jgi:hypothetical protein